MKSNFNDWIKTFKANISDYKFYVNFEKVLNNVEKIKLELNILNSLIYSKNIENDFIKIIKKFPKTIKCIPILLAIRKKYIFLKDEKISFDEKNINNDKWIYKIMNLMRKSSLFTLLSEGKIKNLIDYAIGIEVGLDSNARKNRTGKLMQELVESFILKSKFKFEYGKTYFKEINLNQIFKLFNINNLKKISENNVQKKFDFVIKNKENIYLIETNFYSSPGSKLNEIARSYMFLNSKLKQIKNFYFIWITDGLGWFFSKNNLKKAFYSIDNIWNINDLENQILDKTIK
ncbi:type II restriction endonuclease [[Mycoplasma] collis]|uniref:type II restriction endonuclease n=1 Tax=[Mycoplasma] collis TaxID=2127 RepID=UPI00051AE0C9|nr:type II restriction endonuclease [[Mycoplasma] collis]